MKKRKFRLNSKGDTLVTALVSALILGIVALGLIDGFFVTVKTNTLGDYIERSSVIAQYVMERVCSLPPDSPVIKSNNKYGDFGDPNSNDEINALISGLTDDITEKFPFYKTGDDVNYGIQVDIQDPVGTLDNNVTPNLKVITVTVEPSTKLKEFIMGKKNVSEDSGKVVLGSISRTLKYVQ